VRIKWFGQSSFLITADSGVRVITDPYVVWGPFKYDPVNEAADVVTVSHDHLDHNHLESVLGTPVVLREPGDRVVQGIEFSGIPSYHDMVAGAERGNNTIFRIVTDSVVTVHLGDLGQIPDAEQIRAIGPIDVLLVPVGGHYTIDAARAGQVCELLAPRLIVPMHFRNRGWDNPDYPVRGVEPFLDGKTDVVRCPESEFEPLRLRASGGSRIVVLTPARLPQ
jgi:L-ascorbate metabolism protein UlaG (beta-lactamase superfamily)